MSLEHVHMQIINSYVVKYAYVEHTYKNVAFLGAEKNPPNSMAQNVNK